MTNQEIIEIFKTIGTWLTALFAAWIAYKQFVVNKQKISLDLYERRLKIYAEVKDVLVIINDSGSIEHVKLSRFRNATAEADFLFGFDISGYLDEISKKALRLIYLNKQLKAVYEPKPSGYDHNMLTNDIREHSEWFASQFSVAKDKFKKYLSFHDLY